MSVKQKKIAVISADMQLGDETMGATRYGYIAKLLHEHGYQVDVLTSSFQHWEKRQRDVDHFIVGTDAYTVRFLHEPGYAKNVDLRRINSHKVLTKSLELAFEQRFDYDLIYCQIPPNNLSRTAAEYAHVHGIPFIVDVNDLWPEAMYMAFNVPLISKALFSNFEKDARETYRLASGVVGTSAEYASRPFRDRPEDIPSVVVYVGNDIAAFDEGVRCYAPTIDKPADEFWVTYAGNLSTSYDIGTLIDAARMVKSHGERGIRFKILGSGPSEEAWKTQAEFLKADVDFLGYRPHAEMAAWLAASDLLVNSLVKGAPQSIVTKIGDYLASGHPMVNTSSSREFCTKVIDDDFGVNVEPEDSEGLAEAIESLYRHPEDCARMGRYARQIALEQFDRPRSYKKIIALVDGLLEIEEYFPSPPSHMDRHQRREWVYRFVSDPRIAHAE